MSSTTTSFQINKPDRQQHQHYQQFINAMGGPGSALLACLKDDKFVDLSIICRDKTIRAHRVVLAAQSDFFVKA
jgi:hypothetical protein